jgi:hypothetical protein
MEPTEVRMATAAALLAVSAIVLVLGYLIGPRRRLGLIAGLEVPKVRDPHGLGRWVGTGLMVIGAVEALISLALFAADRMGPLIMAYVGVSLLGSSTLLVGMRRYL